MTALAPKKPISPPAVDATVGVATSAKSGGGGPVQISYAAFQKENGSPNLPTLLSITATVDHVWVKQLAAEALAPLRAAFQSVLDAWQTSECRARWQKAEADLAEATAKEAATRRLAAEAERAYERLLEEDSDLAPAEQKIAEASARCKIAEVRVRALQRLAKRLQEQSHRELRKQLESVRAERHSGARRQCHQARDRLQVALAELFGPFNHAEYVFHMTSSPAAVDQWLQAAGVPPLTSHTAGHGVPVVNAHSENGTCAASD
jgi:hypothetical protein